MARGEAVVERALATGSAGEFLRLRKRRPSPCSLTADLTAFMTSGTAVNSVGVTALAGIDPRIRQG